MPHRLTHRRVSVTHAHHATHMHAHRPVRRHTIRVGGAVHAPRHMMRGTPEAKAKMARVRAMRR